MDRAVETRAHSKGVCVPAKSSCQAQLYIFNSAHRSCKYPRTFNQTFRIRIDPKHQVDISPGKVLDGNSLQFDSVGKGVINPGDIVIDVVLAQPVHEIRELIRIVQLILDRRIPKFLPFINEFHRFIFHDGSKIS